MMFTFGNVLLRYSTLLLIVSFVIIPGLFMNDMVRLLVMLVTGLFAIRCFTEKLPNWIYVSIFFTIYLSLYCVVSGESILSYIQMIFLLLFTAIAYKYTYNLNAKDLKIVLSIILALNFYVAANTILHLYTDPNVARLLSNSNEESLKIAAENVGGFGLVYSNVLAISVFIMTIRMLKGNKHWLLLRYIVLICLLTSSVLIIMSGYSTALLIWFLQIIYWFVWLPVNNNFLRAFIVIFVLLVLYMGNSWLSFLLELSADTFYERKLVDILSSMEASESVGVLGDRTSRYLLSWETFLGSPIMGGLGHYSIGGHSGILDNLAVFGVFSLFLFYSLITPLYRITRDFNQTSVFLIVFLILIFVNPLIVSYVFPIALLFIYSRLSQLSNK